MKIRIYDIEVYKNLFMVTVLAKTGEHRMWYISENHSDLQEIVSYFNNRDLCVVGYNNSEYDDLVINYIIKNFFYLLSLKPKEVCKAIFKVSTSIIQEDNRENKYADYFQSVDLMKVGGIQKGLKQVAVNLKHPIIQDLPIPWDKPIKEQQIPKIAKYNLNDDDITLKLYNNLIEKIRLRKNVTDTYNINVMSDPDSGMANKFFEKFYSERTGFHPKDFKDLRTNRKVVKFKDAILPVIQFKTKELNKVLTDLRTTGGVVIDDEGGKITFSHPTFRFGGIEYQIGAGGLHSVDAPGLFVSDKKYVYRDADVGSFYPNIMINYGIKPAHLDDCFIDILRMLTTDRLLSKRLAGEAKKAGDILLYDVHQTKADAFKIVVNATFGKLGFKYSFLYDPLAMIQVTLNGQLFLLMLIEELTLRGFQIISANTDGIICKVERSREKEYYNICKEWEQKTKFGLEYVDYKKYIRTTVNDYLVLKEYEGEFNEKEHIKAKGDLDKNLWKDVTKGFDKPIVSLAVHNHFIHGIPIDKTIRNHKDILDFCMSKKNGDKYTNEYHYMSEGEHIIVPLQKSVRFFVSKRGGKLLKASDNPNANTSSAIPNKHGGFDYVMQPKRKYTNLAAGELVTLANDITPDLTLDRVKDMYYIIQAQTMIDKIVPKQQVLSLFS